MVGRTLATIYKNGAVFDLVTDSTGEDVPSLRGTLRCGVFQMNYLPKALDNCC
jgi:hypothetical protein